MWKRRHGRLWTRTTRTAGIPPRRPLPPPIPPARTVSNAISTLHIEQYTNMLNTIVFNIFVLLACSRWNADYFFIFAILSETKYQRWKRPMKQPILCTRQRYNIVINIILFLFLKCGSWLHSYNVIISMINGQNASLRPFYITAGYIYWKTKIFFPHASNVFWLQI